MKQGRLARRSVRAVERSALLGRLEFELTGMLHSHRTSTHFYIWTDDVLVTLVLS